MILILEDDADREAFSTGRFLWHTSPQQKDVMVWISIEAYAKEFVLAKLRKKIEEIRYPTELHYGHFHNGWNVALHKVLALIDEEQQ